MTLRRVHLVFPWSHEWESFAVLSFCCSPFKFRYWYFEPSLYCCCSVTKSCLTLQPHGLQNAMFPCLSLSPGICSNSCSLSWWRYSTISSRVTLFSSCLQSFPASRSFPMNQLFPSGVLSIGASASVLPVNIQCWFPLRLISLISLLSMGLLRAFTTTTIQKHNSKSSSVVSLLYGLTLIPVHDYWKNHSFDDMDFCQQSDVSAF